MKEGISIQDSLKISHSLELSTEETNSVETDNIAPKFTSNLISIDPTQYISFVPGIVRTLTTLFKSLGENKQKVCIRKMSKQLEELNKDAIDKYTILVECSKKISEYYSSRKDNLSTTIEIGTRKHEAFGSFVPTNTPEAFGESFINQCYIASINNKAVIRFYLELKSALDIPKNDTNKVFKDQGKMLVDIMSPHFKSINLNSIKYGRIFRKSASSIYELNLEIKIDDKDYGKIFKDAKLICDQERKAKNLE